MRSLNLLINPHFVICFSSHINIQKAGILYHTTLSADILMLPNRWSVLFTNIVKYLFQCDRPPDLERKTDFLVGFSFVLSQLCAGQGSCFGPKRERKKSPRMWMTPSFTSVEGYLSSGSVSELKCTLYTVVCWNDSFIFFRWYPQFIWPVELVQWDQSARLWGDARWIFISHATVRKLQQPALAWPFGKQHLRAGDTSAYK